MREIEKALQELKDQHAQEMATIHDQLQHVPRVETKRKRNPNWSPQEEDELIAAYEKHSLPSGKYHFEGIMAEGHGDSSRSQHGQGQALSHASSAEEEGTVAAAVVELWISPRNSAVTFCCVSLMSRRT